MGQGEVGGRDRGTPRLARQAGADVSENLRNMRAQLGDLSTLGEQRTFQIIDKLLEQLREASPEIKARPGAEVESSRHDSTSWKLTLRRTSATCKHGLRISRALGQQQPFPRSSMSPARRFRRHRQRSRRSGKPSREIPGLARQMEADVSENLRNKQAQPEDLRGA